MGSKRKDFFRFIDSLIGFEVSLIFTNLMVAWAWAWFVVITYQRLSGKRETEGEMEIMWDSNTPYIYQEAIPYTTPFTWLSETIREWFGGSPRWLDSLIEVIGKVPDTRVGLIAGVLIIALTANYAGGAVLDKGRVSGDPDKSLHALILLETFILFEYWGDSSDVLSYILACGLIPFAIASVIALKNKSKSDIGAHFLYSFFTIFGWLLILFIPLIHCCRLIIFLLGFEHRKYAKDPGRWGE